MNSLFGCIKWLFRSRRTKQLEDKGDLDKEPVSPLGLASLVVSFFALIVSICTIVVMVQTSIKTNRLTEKLNDKTNTLTERLNSKEYQMSENLKYDILEMIAVLRSIEYKAWMVNLAKQDVDFSRELQSLNDIESRPGFIIFLKSIDDKYTRTKIEYYLRMLTNVSMISPMSSLTDNRLLIKEITDVLAHDTYFNKSMNMDFEELVKQLSLMEVPSRIDKEYGREEIEDRPRDFIEMLMDKGYDDPDLLYYYYVFCEPDPELAQRAVDSGAFPMSLDTSYGLSESQQRIFWKKALWEDIEEEYIEEYGAFCKKR